MSFMILKGSLDLENPFSGLMAEHWDGGRVWHKALVGLSLGDLPRL